MAKVKKLNRVLTVNDNAVETYLERGYDQIDENGKVIKEATGGKSVSVAQFNALKKENEALKQQIEELKGKESSLDLTVSQIKVILDELGIEYNAKDNKPTLIELLINATKSE